MADGKDKKREAPTPIRYSKEELEQLGRDAERAGMSRHAYIRYRSLSQPPPRQARRPSIEEQILGQLLTQAIKIHQALNGRIATGDLDGLDPLTIQEAVEAIPELRTAFLKAMGRGP